MEESQHKAEPLNPGAEKAFQDVPNPHKKAPSTEGDKADFIPRNYSSDDDPEYTGHPSQDAYNETAAPISSTATDDTPHPDTEPNLNPQGEEKSGPHKEGRRYTSKKNKRSWEKKNDESRAHKANPNKQRKDSHSKRSSKPSRERKTRGTHKTSRFTARDELNENTEPLLLGDLPGIPLFNDSEALEDLITQLASDESKAPLDFNAIYRCSLNELVEEAKKLGIECTSAPRRNELIDSILSAAAAAQQAIHITGVLEILKEGYGLLTYEQDSYDLSPQSAFVPAAFIQHYGLKRGHIVKAQAHPRREGTSCPFIIKLLQVMDRPMDELSQIPPFTENIPYYPLERLRLESDGETDWDNLSMRIVDLLTPVGYGQRGLIVAPPRTGKTVLLQGIANSIQTNHPEAHLIVLLIDERPEEVTDFRRQVKGEVISSTFDQSAESHCHAAEMVIEKARRMVEVGKDVIILLDSITRLARAYNTMSPNSGKILSGGVEAGALQKPKRFFGSARNIEGGGSLTILATALIDTGSRMDEVIFEEFKGTGNMELHLARSLAEKRIFPSLSFEKSGTRKEELLYHPDEMGKIYSLRRAMKGVPSEEAMEMLIKRVKKTSTNVEFLMSLSR